LSAPTLSSTLGRFAASLRFENLSTAVVDSVVERLVDTIGICVAAGQSPELEAVFDVVAAGGGTGQAGVIGFECRLPAPAAALVNGVLAHSLDYDDTHLPSILHPSAVLVPVALAAAELSGAHGGDLVAALAAGYEIDVRLGMAAYDPVARNNVFFERGLHATSICGCLAGAAVAARLLGLSPEQTQDAIGIAASMGAGLLEANRVGGSVKKLHCGLAARAAIQAAQFARAGFTGPPTALEGRFGFYQALTGGAFDPGVVTGGLGTAWETPRIFFKPYPANHFTHAGIDAALKLRARPGFDVARVEHLTLGVAAPTLRTIAEPRVEKARPRSGYHAKFSGPFTVATALLHGSPGLAAFTDQAATDEATLALAARVECVEDPRCAAIYPNHFPAVLRADLGAGGTVVEEVLVNRGSPDNPLTRAELEGKFTANCAAAGMEDRAPAILAAVRAVGEAGIGALWQAIPGRPLHPNLIQRHGAEATA
jgi:2-methylcitrate dehydratase PrpD